MAKKLKPPILLLLLAFLFSCSNQNEEEKVHELMLKAREYNVLSNFDGVIEITKECLEIDPENAEAYFMMGNAYFNKREWKNAVVSYDNAVFYDPHYADAFFNRGKAKEQLNNHDGACDDYRKAHELGKANVRDNHKHCF